MKIAVGSDHRGYEAKEQTPRIHETPIIFSDAVGDRVR